MEYEWDEKKNRANIKKHGFDFADAWEIFEAAMIVNPDTSQDYGEERWIGLGDYRGRIVLVVFTEPARETRRIISVRKAMKAEQKYYENTLKDEFGNDR